MVDVAQDEPKLSTSPKTAKARPGITSLHNINVKLRVHRPKSIGSSETPTGDPPFFMSSEVIRKARSSLSPINSPTPGKKPDGQLEPNTKAQEDFACENMAWDVINREISEWQNVCQTGRSSWWSPVSKWTRAGAHSTWQEEIRATPPWRMQLDHGRRSGQRYDEQRRAVTDSYLADNNNVQDLAHLIAVQLLGSCFTLPPEHISSYATSAYHCFDTSSASELPDSRLISSLRMHTEARHSPSFGHQARNTSPAYRWQGAYDGPSPSTSRGSSGDYQASNIDTSRKTSRNRKVHRALNVTESSTVECSTENHSELCGLSEILPATTKSAWHRLKEVASAAEKFESSSSDRGTKSCPSTPGEFNAQPLYSSRLATEKIHGHIPDPLQARRQSQTPDQPSRPTLRSVIRSEPHHIYIQPVKELVVKRWQTLRRRLRYGPGYSHHGGLVNRGADARLFASTSSRSTPGEGSIASPALSSDGRDRRRQARESGDMYYNSMYRDPRHSTLIPAVDHGVANPQHVEHPSLDSICKKSSVAEEAISNAFADSGLTTAASRSFTLPNSLTSSTVPSPPVANSRSLNSKVKGDSGHFNGRAVSNSKPLNSPPTSSVRRHGQRRHQRSNLSEICTPEEAEERSTLSRLNSPRLTSPKEESGSEGAVELPSQVPTPDEGNEGRLLDHGLLETAQGLPGPGEEKAFGLRLSSEKVRRPSFVRTSTSGTQVFRPGDDGVELDGMPTGPSARTWDDQGQGKRRKERSFL